jgi:hypothetical protein
MSPDGALDRLQTDRFVVFAFDEYYPGGGLSDVESRHDDRDEAITAAKGLRRDNVYVYDRLEDKVVWDLDDPTEPPS